VKPKNNMGEAELEHTDRQREEENHWTKGEES